jgi:hypothetical protein
MIAMPMDKEADGTKPRSKALIHSLEIELE